MIERDVVMLGLQIDGRHEERLERESSRRVVEERETVRERRTYASEQPAQRLAQRPAPA
ncbi:hypothetical protein RchiOBHm_Chr6g0311791 [Rosa chinensis]|uniref:Uncharacterized protein n=1 Tax=Rosa chinensis TaxID=74649 RepID=A0A2P6Q1I1_ROSCH|nr:hypothetical protein RchiOBHm_Chr6g0311791 [Rosa chinensis]